MFHLKLILYEGQNTQGSNTCKIVQIFHLIDNFFIDDVILRISYSFICKCSVCNKPVILNLVEHTVPILKIPLKGVKIIDFYETEGPKFQLLLI